MTEETTNSAKSKIALLEEEGDVAADYLEALLDIADLDGDIDIDVENDRAALAIVGKPGDLNHLVGPNGEVLDSLQELTRLAVQTSTGERSRLMLDIDSFRADKKRSLQSLPKRRQKRSNQQGWLSNFAQ